MENRFTSAENNFQNSSRNNLSEILYELSLKKSPSVLKKFFPSEKI